MAPAGILLAGGQSRRMGKDKALLPVPGQEPKTFIAHLASTLSLLCSELVLVVRDAPQVEIYRQQPLPPGVAIITDSRPGGGPLIGLYSGLATIRASHALVCAVDMPFVQPELVAFLLSQPLDDSLVVPMVATIPQVLLAVYPKQVLPAIEQRIGEGRRDPRSLLAIAPVHYIEEAQLREIDPQLRSFININTPEELSDQENAL